VVRVDFDSKRGWSAYGYLQGTIRATGSRAENNRAGVGGTFALSERVNVGGEVSTGDGGIGAQISGTWQVDERTQTYMSYSLAPDSADNRYRGQLGQFTYGGSRQVTDNIYVLAEQTYHHGDGPNGRVRSRGTSIARRFRSVRHSPKTKSAIRGFWSIGWTRAQSGGKAGRFAMI